jgi:hypothetical protein
MTVDTLYIGADVEALRDTLAMVPLTPTPTPTPTFILTHKHQHQHQHVYYHYHYHQYTQDIERAKATEHQAAIAAREAGHPPPEPTLLNMLYAQEMRLNRPNSPLLVPITASKASMDKVLSYFIDYRRTHLHQH